MRIVLSILLLVTIAGPVAAGITNDTISIKQVFVAVDGSFAVQAEGVITNASAERDCAPGHNWAKAWAGFDSSVSDRMVSVILSAHAQNSLIQITTDGCNGSWHKIRNVYIKQE